MTLLESLYLYKLLEEELKDKDENVKPENTEEGLKYFFPYLYNAISGRIQFIVPLLTFKDKKETDMINSKISNLNVDVYINNHPLPNAYTLPAVSSRAGFQALSILTGIPLVKDITLIPYILYSFTKLKNLDLSNVTPERKIIFNNPGNVKILCWETKGLKGMLNEEERTAVILHEIGHWVRYAYPVISRFFLISSFANIMIIPLIFGIALARTGEYRADEFAKACGYGKEFISALDKIAFRRRRNISILGKISDVIRVISNKIHNFLDYILPLHLHPAPTKRIKNVRESTLIENYLITESVLSSVVYPTLRKIISPVDKLIARNVDHIFPLAK